MSMPKWPVGIVRPLAARCSLELGDLGRVGVERAVALDVLCSRRRRPSSGCRRAAGSCASSRAGRRSRSSARSWRSGGREAGIEVADGQGDAGGVAVGGGEGDLGRRWPGKSAMALVEKRPGRSASSVTKSATASAVSAGDDACRRRSSVVTRDLRVARGRGPSSGPARTTSPPAMPFGGGPAEGEDLAVGERVGAELGQRLRRRRCRRGAPAAARGRVRAVEA